MKKLLFLFGFLFSTISIFAQLPPPCPSNNTVPADICSQTCIYCNFSGIQSTTSGYTAQTPAGFCGSIENEQWVGFIAGQSNATFTALPSNCINGDGVQVALYTGCSGAPLGCYGGMGGGGNTPATVSVSNMIPGQNYFLMVDGFAGDHCDVTIIASPPSAITAPIPSAPISINGPLTATINSQQIYSVPIIPGASAYTWTAPSGALINGMPSPATTLGDSTGSTVTITFGNSSGVICVNGNNSCFTGPPLCRTVSVNNPCNSFSWNHQVHNASCVTSNDGKIVFSNVIGNQHPILYSIDGGIIFQTDSTFNNLLPINYHLQVKETITNCVSTIDTVNLAFFDTIPPILSCPADLTTTSAPSTCNSLVFLNLPTGTDNCSMTSPNYTPFAVGVPILNFGTASAGQFPVGTTSVSYTGADDSGNTGTCSFTVTVTDTELPSLLNCPSNQNLCIVHTSSDTIATWIPPTGSDNCPSFIVTSSHNSGMAFPFGTTIVSYVVTDASTNTANCSFEITVSSQPIWYVDTDGDGFGDTNTNQYACTQPIGYVDNMLDCNDTDSLINPNAIEICNGLDDNCDGQIDEGVTTDYWPDFDMDGFGDATANSIASCSTPTNYVTNNNDCDDSNPSIFPSQTEICNGIDDDCDGLIDENLACRRPSWINATNIGSDSVLLNWGMSCGVTAYRVRYKPLSNVTHRYKVLLNIPINSLNIYDLCYNTVYQVGVSALCNGTWTSWRNTTFTTASTATCTNPYFTGINVTHDNITLFWIDIQGESHQRLQWRERLNKNNKGFVNVPTNLNSYTITGLKANTDYEYRIRVRCNGNWLSVPPYNRAITGLAPLPNLSTQRATNSSENLFLKISPNPSAGRITATTNLLGIKDYIILSPQGSLMTQWQDERQNLELDLSDLPGGAYFLMVKNEFGERIQEKVVILK